MAIVIALGMAAGTPACAQTQPPPTATAPIPAQDPAAEALLKRFQSANDPREAQRAFDELAALAAKAPRAAYLCGVVAAQEGSVVANREVAMRCLEDAAKAGIAEAQHRLAVLLLTAKPIDPKQRATAERWLTSAARELPESVYMLALLRADHSPDPERAHREVVDKAAQAGYAPAQYELARRMYAQGSSEAKASARAWLEKAAAQELGEAAVELALMLEADRREQDTPRIVALLETASRAGSPRGDYALAMRLAEARGMKRDTERALALVKRSAASGHLASEYALGFMLSHGIGGESDESAALAWFRRAAARGHPAAMYAIGNAYANGWGVGESMDIAYQWYCKSAQAGDASAAALVKGNKASDCLLPAVSNRN